MRPGEYRKSRRIAVVIHKREIYGRLQLTSALVRRYSNLTRIAPSSAFGTQQTVAAWRMSASLIGHLGSSAFQTIHHHSVDVARGLVLLFGIGTGALPSWDSRMGRNNLLGGLAVLQTVGPSGQTVSPHPSSREGHHSTAGWSSIFCYRI